MEKYFTSEPLESSLEITRYPRMTLQLSSTTTENALHLYLEAVADNGEVIYLTEGLLHTLHRRRSDSPAPYWIPSETAQEKRWRTFREADALPMVPGEQTELVFELLPTSTVVPQGYRLRIALAGADAESFARVPASGPSELTISYGGDAPSFLELPSRARPDLDRRSAPVDLEQYEAGRSVPRRVWCRERRRNCVGC